MKNYYYCNYYYNDNIKYYNKVGTLGFSLLPRHRQMLLKSPGLGLDLLPQPSPRAVPPRNPVTQSLPLYQIHLMNVFPRDSGLSTRVMARWLTFL